MRAALLALVTLFLCQIALAEPTIGTPTIGTMSAEIRGKDKRIDIARTIDALVRMKVNTYYYLIWQDEHDWDDLPAFCDAAAQQNIAVWAYLVPWSETPLKKKEGWGYSEPFKTDYVSWASAIAKLSLQHPSLVGYVIDDFYDNTTEDHFTPTYVRKMVGAGKRINPNLKFYPLMYFQTPWVEFVNRFATIVDGVVICYPKSEAGIRNAATYLTDRRHGPTAIVELPRHKGAERGDGAAVTVDVSMTDPDNAEISFYYDATDDIEGDTSAQYATLRIDNKTVWQTSTEGRMRDAIINVDLRRFLRRPEKMHIEFSVVTARTGVPEMLPVVARFDDIRVYGAGKTPNQFLTDLNLKGHPSGKYEVTIMPGSRESGRYRLPIILMPSGEQEQYEKRYDTRGTPEAVAAKVRLCDDMLKAGIVNGVVPYRTPLLPKDPYFQAIQQEFAAYRAAPAKSESN